MPQKKEGEVMTVKPEQIEVLKPYIDNIEDLVKSDDVQSVLDAIDDVIVENILANNDEPDDEGIKLQKIYDEIFNQNEFSWDDPNLKKICGECHFKDKNPELCHAVEPPMKKPFVPTDISSCSFLRESQWQRMPKEKQNEVNEYVAERSKKKSVALDDKLKEYADRFGQNFPVFFFRNKTEAEIIKMVEECLDRNKPFQIDDNGADDV